MLMIISIFFTLALVLLFRLLNGRHKAPILGVYQQANKYYWVKFLFMLLVLSARQLFKYLRRRLAIELGKSDDGTIHIHNEELTWEKTHDLGDHALAVDAVYFNGTSKTGASVMCGVARRQNGVCDAFLFLKTEDGELLSSPKLPDSYLQQKDFEEGTYAVEGISVSNLIPMRSWQIKYNGEMKPKSDPEKRVNVELSLTWSTAYQPFNYDKISPVTMAQDMAREPWSSDYFKMLKKYHQVHYEQMGDLEGSAVIDGKSHNLQMRCVRDHSFSQHRDWRNFHRYVYHFIYLDNGDCIAVGSVSQPLILSHLTIGYLCRNSDQTVWPVTFSDFHLYQHGESQILPKDYGFSFNAGGNNYAVQVLLKEEETFYIGKEREAKFYERWSNFKVNGIDGWGCVEWYYNNIRAGKLDK